MTWVKRLFNFYVFSNIHVALAAFSLTYLTSLVYNINDFSVPLFVFFATIMSYNLIRFFSIESINPFSYKFIKTHRDFLIALTILSAVATVYFFLKLNINAMLFLVPFIGFTVFYFLPLKWKGAKITLRKITTIKIFLIGFSWASVTYLLPLIQNVQTFDLGIWVGYVQRLLFLIVIILPFDIRDLDSDEDKLRTLPQILGEAKVKRLGLFLMMVFLGLDFLTAKPQDFQVHLIVVLCTLFLLFKATKKQHKYYSAFWVESLPIIWLLVYLFWI